MTVTGKRVIYVACDGCHKRSPKQPTEQAAVDYATANGWIIPVSAYALGEHYCPECGARLTLLAKAAAAQLGIAQEPTP